MEFNTEFINDLIETKENYQTHLTQFHSLLTGPIKFIHQCLSIFLIYYLTRTLKMDRIIKTNT